MHSIKQKKKVCLIKSLQILSNGCQNAFKERKIWLWPLTTFLLAVKMSIHVRGPELPPPRVSRKFEGSSFAFSKAMIAEKTSEGATFLVFAAFFKTETRSATRDGSNEDDGDDDGGADAASNASVSVSA
jgi:hypothetical protein